METALDEEGLLRLSGSRADMDALRAAFESGQPIDFRTPPRDAHTVAGMLKAFFRELPEPLLSPELNRRAADVVAQELPEITTALELRQIIVSMSDTAYETTKLLVRFLIAVAEHSFKNRMHKDNVLTVMIPTLQCVPAVFSIAMDCFELFFDDESTGRVAGGTNGRQRAAKHVAAHRHIHAAQPRAQRRGAAARAGVARALEHQRGRRWTAERRRGDVGDEHQARLGVARRRPRRRRRLDDQGEVAHTAAPPRRRGARLVAAALAGDRAAANQGAAAARRRALAGAGARATDRVAHKCQGRAAPSAIRPPTPPPPPPPCAG
jgi:hypothetical protein